MNTMHANSFNSSTNSPPIARHCASIETKLDRAIETLHREREFLGELVGVFLDRSIEREIPVPFTVRKATFGRHRGWLLHTGTNGRETMQLVIDADQRQLMWWHVKTDRYEKRPASSIVTRKTRVTGFPETWTEQRMLTTMASLLV
jgi:hypothetical protein